ncbi:MAG: DUF2292 domain-containing protein [Firmicutes bacterium]|jgi:hypothetical protein|nr:DUF2292 domain-containing protein [Bacillota bacterium]
MSLKPEDLPVLCTTNSTDDRGVYYLLDHGKERANFADEVLTEKEKNLIRILREINYGEVVILVQERQPVRIEEVKKSIKL